MTRLGDTSRPGTSHNKECRQRVEAAVRANDQVRERLERTEERKNSYLARELERADEQSGATAFQSFQNRADPGSSPQGPSR